MRTPQSDHIYITDIFFPRFYKSHSMIILEEIANAGKEVISVEKSTFLSFQDDVLTSIGHNCNNNYTGRNNSVYGGRHNGRDDRGRGRHSDQNGSRSQPQ